MSCMMLTVNQIGRIAATLADMFNTGLAQGGDSYTQYGIYMNGKEWAWFLRNNECLDRYGACDARKLARLLYLENVAAYNGRYEEHYVEENADAASFPKYLTLYSLAKYAPYDGDIHRCKLAQWHFDFSVLLDHYLYQIDEGATNKGELYTLIKEQSDAVKSCIVYMDPRRRDTFDLLREMM